MSLRQNIVRCLSAIQRGLKNAKRPFLVWKLHLSLENSLLQSILCVKTASDKVVRHSLIYLSAQKNDWWRHPRLRENWQKLTHPF